MRYFLFTLLLSLAFSVHATDELVVSQTSNETSWAISSIKELSFDGNGVKITFNDETSVYYAQETLNMLKFNVTPSSGLSNIHEEKDRIRINGNIITVTNCSSIKVYSLNGTLMAQTYGSMLDISHLAKGAYVVLSEGLISKIIKQ